MNIYKVTITLTAKNEPAARKAIEYTFGSATAAVAVVEKVGKEGFSDR